MGMLIIVAIGGAMVGWEMERLQSQVGYALTPISENGDISFDNTVKTAFANHLISGLPLAVVILILAIMAGLRYTDFGIRRKTV